MGPYLEAPPPLIYPPSFRQCVIIVGGKLITGWLHVPNDNKLPLLLSSSMLGQALGITYGAVSIRHKLVVGYVVARLDTSLWILYRDNLVVMLCQAWCSAVCIILWLHVVQGQPISLLQLEPFGAKCHMQTNYVVLNCKE